MKLLLFAFVFTGLPFCAIAQTKTILHDNQVWLGYYNQTRLTDKWAIGVDLHLRSKEKFFTGLSQSIARVGIIYYLTETTRITAGYAYSTMYPSDSINTIALPEHRVWQQLQWQSKYKHGSITQRLRVEQRFRTKTGKANTNELDYTFNWRLRYNFITEFPLGKKIQPNLFSLILSNEININVGKQILYNYFDQNRFFAGLKYTISPQNNIQFGYLNVFQQQAAGNKFRNINVARIFYYQNFDLRKIKK